MFIDDVAEFPLVQNKRRDTYYNMQIWLDRFEEQMMIEKLDHKTIKSYLEALKGFMDFLYEYRKSIKMDQIGAKFINRYLIAYQYKIGVKAFKKKHISKEELDVLEAQVEKKELGRNDAIFTILESFENTLSHRLVVLKKFLRYITENNKDLHDYVKIFNQVVHIKIKEKVTTYLTKQELEKVSELMQQWPNVYKQYKKKSSLKYAYADAFMMMVFVLTGARGEEITLVRQKDIKEAIGSKDGEAYYLIDILHGKGNKIRTVSVQKKHIEKFVTYLKENLPDENYYMSSRFIHGSYMMKPCHPNTIRRFGNLVFDILKIKKTGLHTIRRGYATKQLMYGEADISIVAKELGNTPAILHKHYLKHNVEDLMEK